MALRISMYLFQKDDRALDRKLLTHKILISFKCTSVYHWLYFLRFLFLISLCYKGLSALTLSDPKMLALLP